MVYQPRKMGTKEMKVGASQAQASMQAATFTVMVMVLQGSGDGVVPGRTQLHAHYMSFTAQSGQLYSCACQSWAFPVDFSSLQAFLNYIIIMR